MTSRTGILAFFTALVFVLSLGAADAGAQMGRMMDDNDDYMWGMGMGPHGGKMMRDGGYGMAGHPGMMGCRMAHDPDVDVKVSEVDGGITITLTSKDETTAKKLKLRARMMNLVREMLELEKSSK